MTNLLFGLAIGNFELEDPHAWLFAGKWYEITNLVMTEWVVVIGLIILAVVINRTVLSGTRTKLRGSLELLLDFLEDWYASFIGGRKYARQFLPLLGTLFLFIIISNYIGLLPMAGSPGFAFAPTARWGSTLALALVVAVAVQVISVKVLGIKGWLKHLWHLGPLSILEEFIHPFSLSVRLFGNIFGEETLLAVVIFLAPYFVPIPIMGLSMFFGLIQAIVFTTLTAVYIGAVLEAHGHGAHSEEHGAEAHSH